MKDLISFYNKKDKDIMTKAFRYAKENITCLFPGHYSTHFTINSHTFVFCTLEFNETENCAFVWEMGQYQDEPIIKTEISGSARSFQEMLPYIILATRQLLAFKRKTP